MDYGGKILQELEMTKKKLTSQQQDGLDFIVHDRGDLILKACAGTGKTFELIEMIKCVRDKRTFLGAFNRNIADELQKKVEEVGFDRTKVFANTLHSAGIGAWRKLYPNVQVKGDKNWDIIERLRADDPEDHPHRKMGYFVDALVSLAKQKAIGFLDRIDDRNAWYEIVEHFDLEEKLEAVPNNGGEYDLVEMGIDFAIRVYRESIKLNPKVVDFDDMLFAPLIGNARVYTYDFVMIDEAQDTNNARRALAIKMLKPHTGRLIAVGDPKQAIYGFTGADSDSLDLIQSTRNAKVLPLTVTFRCGKNIVNLAKQWVPEIEAHESNPDGIVRSVPLHGYKVNEGTATEEYVPGFWDEKITPDDAILCRNTRPLVETAYGLLRRGIACRVAGQEIGEGLIALANRWKIKNLGTLRDKLRDHMTREIQKWQAAGRESMAMTIEDKIETLICLIDNLMSDNKTDVKDLVEFIKNLFGDPKKGEVKKVVTLMTIHKSKGLEWKKVYLLGRNKFMPSKWAIKDWQLEQEYNLMYVAVTRAMSELVEVKF
jgi:superfamily I DNA/RNA helicase